MRKASCFETNQIQGLDVNNQWDLINGKKHIIGNVLNCEYRHEFDAVLTLHKRFMHSVTTWTFSIL